MSGYVRAPILDRGLEIPLLPITFRANKARRRRLVESSLTCASVETQFRLLADPSFILASVELGFDGGQDASSGWARVRQGMPSSA